MKDEHKQAAQKIRMEVEKAITQHPRCTGETYLQHLWFTIKIPLQLLFVGAALMAHGLFPFLFTSTVSIQIKNFYATLRSRLSKPQSKAKVIHLPSFKKNRKLVDDKVRVAVIGGGFSGTLVVANLVRATKLPIIIEWFEKEDHLAGGVAYSTQDNAHLLNVRADRMGAFPHDTGGFYTWLQSEEGKTASARLWPGKEILPGSFVPRVVYGAYLKSIYEETLRIAKKKSIDTRITQATVVDAQIYAENKQKLVLDVKKDGTVSEVLANIMILATGNLPPRATQFQNGMIGEEEKYYVENIWKQQKESLFPDKVNQLDADSEVVIIGTGLTMVDAMLTLREYGYKGTVTAISRHGWLPAPHTASKPYPAWEWVDNPDTAPDTALGLLVRLRQEVQHAAQAGYSWHSVIDSIRPVTQLAI